MSWQTIFMEPKFFATPKDFRRWFEKNHDRETELVVGFYKKGSGKPSITWPESVDQALCFGWIDGVRHRIDDESYKIRFTPRKARSIWSAVNMKRMDELIEEGLAHQAGLDAYERRDDARSKIYAYERETVKLDKKYESEFKKNKKAWEFFQSQPPGYRKTAFWYILSARQEATRARRLETLIKDSENGERLAGLRRTPGK
jgi:uncharacterized protein YdeI (YjbR/CyaY-like superfamily)